MAALGNKSLEADIPWKQLIRFRADRAAAERLQPLRQPIAFIIIRLLEAV
jgi:hypothetical protein